MSLFVQLDGMCPQEIIKSLATILDNPHGRKVAVYLLSPRDPGHCHPDIVKVLTQGDGNPTR